MRYRVARESDRAAILAFFGRLSPESIRARYLSNMRLSGQLGEREVTRMLDRTRGERLVVVATQSTEIRGIAELFPEDARRGEVAIVVEDAFQGRRVGRWLMRHLRREALQRGVQEFTGDVAYGNARAAALLRRSGGQLRMQLGYGSIRFALELDAAA